MLEDLKDATLATNFGSYPRVGDEPGEQKLRRALHAFDREEISADELQSVERETVKTILGEQADAGLDVVTDGQVAWHDPLSHLARGLEGVEVSGLLRWFDNNFYYRQPVLAKAVRWQRPILLDELEFANAASDRPLKGVVTGPVTFVALSRDDHYRDARAATLAVAEALNREMQSWDELDLAYVQVEEPAFGTRTDLRLMREAYAALRRDLALPVVVAPFFGDVSGSWRKLFELDVDGYHLDLRSHAANAGALDPAGFPDGATLSLGLVDARNTRLEDASELAREAEPVRARIPESCPLLITSNCGLEFLPRETARLKLRRLAQTRDALAGAVR
ncbi:MAG: hypothetical protein ABR599_12700 [Gemmatimonadota bacterium]